MNETISTILNRRSIRAFKQDPINAEDMQLILNAGLYAPSAMNQQSWHFTVVQNKVLLEKINQTCRVVFLNSGIKAYQDRAKSENFNVFYSAPTLIIVSGDEKASYPKNDCTLALGNLLLASASLGIGSCWIHALTHFGGTPEGDRLLQELSIPDGFKIFGSAALGYAASYAPAAPPRKGNNVTILN